MKVISGIIGGLFLVAINIAAIFLISYYLWEYHRIFVRAIPIIGIIFSISFFIIGYKYFSKNEVSFLISSKTKTWSTNVRLYVVTVVIYEFIILLILYNFRFPGRYRLRDFEDLFDNFDYHWILTILPPMLLFVSFKMYMWALNKK